MWPSECALCIFKNTLQTAQCYTLYVHQGASLKVNYGDTLTWKQLSAAATKVRVHCFSGAHRPLLSTSITTNNAELEQLLNKHMTDLHYLFLRHEGEETDIKFTATVIFFISCEFWKFWFQRKCYNVSVCRRKKFWMPRVYKFMAQRVSVKSPSFFISFVHLTFHLLWNFLYSM